MVLILKNTTSMLFIRCLWCVYFRLDKKTREYAALEDEFRMALQIEANRFREVGTSIIAKMNFQFRSRIRGIF